MLFSKFIEEVEQICDTISIMDNGRIITNGTCEELKARVNSKKTIKITLVKNYYLNIDELRYIKGVLRVIKEDKNIYIDCAMHTMVLELLIKLFSKKGIEIDNLEIQPITLENVFLSITGKQLRD